MRATPTETIAALTELAAHRIGLAETYRALRCLPEVTRRAAAVCGAGSPQECRMFGVTWWLPDGTYAAYEVCLAHHTIQGPSGPLARQLPLPRDGPQPAHPEALQRGRALVLVPQAKVVYWAVADKRTVLAQGSEPPVRSKNDQSVQDAARVGAWLHQLLLTYRPAAVLITGEIGIQQSDTRRSRLTSIGIEVRTTYLDTPVDGYRDVLRMERIRGTLQGVAYVHCPGRVYTAPVYRIGEDLLLETARPLDTETTEAFSTAASALAELITREIAQREGLP